MAKHLPLSNAEEINADGWPPRADFVPILPLCYGIFALASTIYFGGRIDLGHGTCWWLLYGILAGIVPLALLIYRAVSIYETEKKKGNYL